METLHKSDYYEILFDKEKSMIVHKALPATSDMNEEQFKQEMLLFTEICEKYNPNRDLVDLADMNYIIQPELQSWVNSEIFPRILEIIQRMALIMPNTFVESVSLQQTMEEELGEKFVRRYFDNKNQAVEWLMLEHVKK